MEKELEMDNKCNEHVKQNVSRRTICKQTIAKMKVEIRNIVLDIDVAPPSSASSPSSSIVSASPIAEGIAL